MSIEEIKKEIKRILDMEETADFTPPYRSLPIAHAFWISNKVDRISKFAISALDEKGKELEELIVYIQLINEIANKMDAEGPDLVGLIFIQELTDRILKASKSK